ncbi:MAG: hypothetical protein ACRD4O_10615 [Bryobacteraceae bacterium]
MTQAQSDRISQFAAGGEAGMKHSVRKRRLFAAFTVVLLVSISACALPHPRIMHEPISPEITRIIDRYVQAVESHENALRGASMKVDITAAIPKLKERGTLRALRRISKIGQITYQLLGFQGSNTVKNQVIVRYLQAERQEQGDRTLAVLPSNYKFKYKGEKKEGNDEEVYVFNVSPRKKRVGLFKGQIWLDPRTYLPEFERGRFVKNPSIFFKKVEFERAYRIENGVAVPEYMNSVIDARLIGKVELSVNYFGFEPKAGSESGAASGADPAPAMAARVVAK